MNTFDNDVNFFDEQALMASMTSITNDQALMANMTSITNDTVHPDLALNSHTTTSGNSSIHTSNATQAFTAPAPNGDLHRASADDPLLNNNDTPSQPEPKQNLPTPASSASKLKRTLSLATGKNAGGNVRALAEFDPENQEIVRLRQTEQLNWSQIAKRLNKQRIAAGKEPRLTANAIYSRYTRNAPRIAAAKGENWQHAKGAAAGDPRSQSSSSSSNRKKTKTSAVVNSDDGDDDDDDGGGDMTAITGFDDAEDELLVMARHEIEEETWELVRKRVLEKGGRDHSAEMCATRYYFL